MYIICICHGEYCTILSATSTTRSVAVARYC
jgi:hypothetical protein